jgi:hypothetical protein
MQEGCIKTLYFQGEDAAMMQEGCRIDAGGMHEGCSNDAWGMQQ